MTWENLAEKAGAPSHMHWAYCIGERPQAYPYISRVYAWEALNNLRLPIPSQLKAWAVRSLIRTEES